MWGDNYVSRDISVGIATNEDLGSIPGIGQTVSGAHPLSCPVDTGDSFTVDEEAEAWHRSSLAEIDCVFYLTALLVAKIL
jgi:hypothetical protein